MSAFDGIFDAFRGAVGGDRAASARVGGWVRTVLDDQAQERLHLMLVWVERVQVRAFDKWYPPQAVRVCQVSSKSASCRAVAIGPCACCGRPVCLRHAMVSADADLLCAPCFAVARTHAKPYQPEPEPAPIPSNTELEEAYRTLRMTEDATNEELKKSYRDLSFKNHPDRKKSDSAKANASARFKEIQTAWGTIAAARGIT